MSRVRHHNCPYHANSVVIDTDGSCPNNGPNATEMAIGVWWGRNHRYNYSEILDVSLGRATNNRAEIHAARIGIEQAAHLGFDCVLVRTDCEYLISAVYHWIPKWEGNGYINNRGTTVANKEDFQLLSQAMEQIHVKFKKVAGHSGDEGNNGADRLAREAIGNYRNQYRHHRRR